LLEVGEVRNFAESWRDLNLTCLSSPNSANASSSGEAFIMYFFDGGDQTSYWRCKMLVFAMNGCHALSWFTGFQLGRRALYSTLTSC
jgi:hypothetical protein